MNIEKQLEEYILCEAEKHIKRYHDYHNQLHIEHERLKKRIKNVPEKIIKTPSEWESDKKHNPFYVRLHAKSIAKSIAKKIVAGTYVPHEPLSKLIPKSNGTERELTVYQIPDSAVSRLFYDRLLAKNKHRFSSFSYAYRNDRNVHFAIQDIVVDIAQDARIFIAEFDFSDFFGTISHEYLFKQFDANGFSISIEEKNVIRAFLSGRPCGMPQGTSISLFLANLVCCNLDKAFEKNGLKFARYSDDTVVWSSDYATICNSFTIIYSFSQEAGVFINPKKSHGISLLSKEGFPSEIKSKESFDFLGYSVGISKVSIKQTSERHIKKQIAYILYKALIQPIREKPLRGLVIPANNRDEALLSAMMQIRRYLYGGLSHREMQTYLLGRQKHLYFKGIMTFYPLLTDEEQLKRLDGWLLSVIHRCVQKRARLLLNHGYDRRHSFPFSVSRSEIIEQYRRRMIDRKRLYEVPSFMLIYRTLRYGLKESGIEKIMNPHSRNY